MATLKELLEEQYRLQDSIAKIEASWKPQLDPLEVDLQAVKEQINQIVSEETTRVFQAAKKDTGTLDFVHEGVKVKVTVGKKVDWDQGKLVDIWNRIASSVDKPDQYITRKETYTVPEKSFTAWPDQIKGVFLPARTLTPKPPVFEFIVIDPSEEIPF